MPGPFAITKPYCPIHAVDGEKEILLMKEMGTVGDGTAGQRDQLTLLSNILLPSQWGALERRLCTGACKGCVGLAMTSI